MGKPSEAQEVEPNQNSVAAAAAALMGSVASQSLPVQAALMCEASEKRRSAGDACTERTRSAATVVVAAAVAVGIRQGM